MSSRRRNAQEASLAIEKPIFRRDKRDPRHDMLHTLAIGIPIGLVLALVLPILFSYFHVTLSRPHDTSYELSSPTILR